MRTMMAIMSPSYIELTEVSLPAGSKRVAGGQRKHGFELVELIGQALNTKWSAMSVAEKKQNIGKKYLRGCV